MYVLYKITWGNGWMFLLSFVPFANAVIAIITMHKLSVKFGHGVGFTEQLREAPIEFIRSGR